MPGGVAMALEGEFEECSTFVKVWTNGRKASTAEKLDSYKFFKQVRPRACQNNNTNATTQKPSS